ncbi:prepilin-type N-terminal cleavage/methylation domain-containing protein [Vibrio aquaticus]|uniref:Prepilin-type N-terminal cleavage/methylation domain-containing protein n=1 Tax=Vibrio aquaticus TaxID=2496559 RepID=A0A432CUQ8_9VIBR|nr:prepilin-type N-terminal cleavage/methylation domain-containing protein [Vibrio aquaticus]RTZ15344.1 prepilin-type N-terminal cleavage/methylation domain-containing protein [Vibrio aquaticus]
MLIRQQGFSLLEVLIAFLLIGIASLGLVKMQSYVEQRSDFAVNSHQALNIAEHKLEWFRTRGASAAQSTMSVASFSSITSGTDTATHSPYTVRWAVSAPAASLSSSLKSLSVSVEWNDRVGETHSVTLQSMVSSYAEFDM